MLAVNALWLALAAFVASGRFGPHMFCVHELGGGLIPAVEAHDVGGWTAAQRAVIAARPTHDDVAGEHPVVGHADGLAEQRLAAVGRPAGEARPEALGASAEQEVLHRRKDRAAQQEL